MKLKEAIEAKQREAFKQGYSEGKKLRPVMPAADGFFVLEEDLVHLEADGSIPIIKRAVMGWRMADGFDRHLMPVTLGYCDEDWAILRPDGSIENQWETFASVEAWQAATKLAREERQARKKHQSS